LKCGITGPIKEFLASNEKTDEVNKLIRQFQVQKSINGVPHFIFNEKYHLSGAQDSETFVELFEELTSK